MKFLSIAKFGALHGVSKQAAAKWKTRGLLVFVDGKVDVDASNLNLAALRKGGAPGAELVVETVDGLQKNEQPVVEAKTVDGSQ